MADETSQPNTGGTGTDAPEPQGDGAEPKERIDWKAMSRKHEDAEKKAIARVQELEAQLAGTQPNTDKLAALEKRVADYEARDKRTALVGKVAQNAASPRMPSRPLKERR